MGITDMFNKIKELIKTLFGFADTNKDGKIDQAEIKAVVEEVKIVAEKTKAAAKKVTTRKPRVTK